MSSHQSRPGWLQPQQPPWSKLQFDSNVVVFCLPCSAEKQQKEGWSSRLHKWLYERLGVYIEDFRFQPEESTVEAEEPLSAKRWETSTLFNYFFCLFLHASSRRVDQLSLVFHRSFSFTSSVKKHESQQAHEGLNDTSSSSHTEGICFLFFIITFSFCFCFRLTENMRRLSEYYQSISVNTQYRLCKWIDLHLRARSQTRHQLLKEPLSLIQLALSIHLSDCLHREFDTVSKFETIRKPTAELLGLYLNFRSTWMLLGTVGPSPCSSFWPSCACP